MDLLGCASDPVPDGLTYSGWADPVVLRNDVAEAVVVPQVGRVMSFRLLDGANVLWTDDALRGQQVSAANPAWEQWKNFGGDRLWPWPQDDWEVDANGEMRFPGVFDQTPLAVRFEGDAVILKGDAGAYGDRFERRISLLPGQASLRIESRITDPRPGTAAWQITQVYVPRHVTARVDPDLETASLHEHMWGELEFGPLLDRPEPGRLVVRVPETLPAKTGLATDRLTAVYPGYTLTLAAEDSAAPGGRTDRGQLWYDATPLMELEMTGPPSAAGEDAVVATTLTITQAVAPTAIGLPPRSVPR